MRAKLITTFGNNRRWRIMISSEVPPAITRPSSPCFSIKASALLSVGGSR
jgi:hypothetical protein